MISKLIHKNLTYKLRGILFNVHNELGRFRNEKQYGDSFEVKLMEARIKFEREKTLNVDFKGEYKSRNRVDFIIEDRLVVELKHVPAITRNDYFQCQRYLKSLNFDLALLVNFRSKYLIIRRVLNHEKYNKEQ